MNGEQEKIRNTIREGKAILGIELGSTRIKAVLIGADHTPVASGNHVWENRLENGIWTYPLESVWEGVQDAYRKMAEDVRSRYGEEIGALGGIGISAMMHGYMVFDKKGKLLVPFRTWRNTITKEASDKLTELFRYPVPQRWSIAHLYQAILNKEPHVQEVDYLVTLEGYVHWKLTGKKVLGIGDIAGMFPVDVHAKDIDQHKVEQFDELVEKENLPWKLRDILPKALVAGENAGVLTQEGAGLLDPGGNLKAGVPMCPPEGDAGTGMTATNSVGVRTGNVSAGTSVFAMVVLEDKLKKVHPEIDLVTTPAGDMVGMVHCNNCTSDLNAWVGIFKEFAQSAGVEMDDDQLFSLLYTKALDGESDGGGLLAYNYLSGEHITHVEEGRPLFVRKPDSRFNLANFMRAHLFAALATLKIGLDILFKGENVKLDVLSGHGGLFKTKVVGQKMMAAAAGVPVSVMETAGQGGAWGIALLAAYMLEKEDGETLDSYLRERVFAGQKGVLLEPDAADVEGFNQFMEKYLCGLAIERAAVEALR
ncbi:xylulokinase [Anaerotalea alkaliphila]|uniref:FGGY-family carbohydrate kinase n=1 Tax=Anaerotalea alkaliphila TaxID=2662126 RepID=A0A7X5HWS3_9FIRM|nr:FGGY-family carbohydrate kinase [Anaerotalea alkaliphila]NDL68046.1 FGGY-family carbohydrate kinase [Anaerotalea alkaliphila]